jgi:hypothetical protein
MFVAGDFLVILSFPIARASLAIAASRGSLGRVSENAYRDGLADLIQPCHAGAARRMPELTEVRCREIVGHGESAVLTLRWEACLPGGTLFPALDADITLVPVGEDATRFSLAGVYRPPPAWPRPCPGPGIWRRAAAATIRILLAGLPAVLAGADAGDDMPCEMPIRASAASKASPAENISPRLPGHSAILAAAVGCGRRGGRRPAGR